MSQRPEQEAISVVACPKIIGKKTQNLMDLDSPTRMLNHGIIQLIDWVDSISGYIQIRNNRQFSDQKFLDNSLQLA
jgi:hypothetical protein